MDSNTLYSLCDLVIYSDEHRSGLYLVRCVLCTGVLNLHQHVSMKEVRGDHIWNKRRGLFLEDGSHNVISYVPFPLELKKQRGEELLAGQPI